VGFNDSLAPERESGREPAPPDKMGIVSYSSQGTGWEV